MTKTHTMRSRLISLVLVLVMVLGCLPMSALAVGTGDRAKINSVSFTAPEKVVANQTYSLPFEVEVKIDATKFGSGSDITTSLYLNFARSNGDFTLAGAGQVKVATITVDGANNDVGSVISTGVYDVTTSEQQDYAKTLKITGAIQYTPTAAVNDGKIYAVVELRDPNGNAVEINQKSGNVSSTLINTDQVTLTVIADNVSLTFQGDTTPYDAASGSKTVSCGSHVQFTLTPDTDWKITDVYAYITSDRTVIEVKKVGSDYYFTVPEADEFSDHDNMRVVLLVDTVSTAETATSVKVTAASSVIAGSVLTATATLKNQAGDRTITGAVGGQMMFTWPDGSITYGYLDDEGNAVSSWTVTDDYAASLTMADREKTVTAKFFGTETYASSEGTSGNVIIGSRTIKAAAGASIVATPTTGGNAVGTLTAKTTYQLALSKDAVFSSQGFAVDSYTATWYESDGAGGWNNLNAAAPEVTPANVGKQYKVSIKPNGQYTQGEFELVIGCGKMADTTVSAWSNVTTSILEGETLRLAALVKSNNSSASGGDIVFKTSEEVVLGTVPNTNGTSKLELNNLPAGTYSIFAYYTGAEGVYAASQSAAITVTVKSAELPADGWSIKVGDTANGTLTVAVENTLSIDAPDSITTDDYRVEWLISKDGGETWALVDTTDTIKVTPANRLYQYRAIVYPDGKYTKPAGGISVTKVTCGTGDASYLPTAITLTAIPGTEVFENEGFTIRAQVTSNNKPVTSGLVTFSYGSGETYVSAIDAGGFAEFPVPNGVTATTTYTATYADASGIYAEVDVDDNVTITVTVKSREIRLSVDSAKAAIKVSDSNYTVGSTVELTAPEVYAKDGMTALTVGKDFYYQWQFSTDYNANPETATWINFSAPAVNDTTIRVTIGDANTAFRVVAMPYGNYMYPATGVATAAVCGNSAKVETTIDSLVVRSVSHGGIVYEGDDVQITATVKAGNDPVTEGIVVFSVKTALDNSRTIGTAAVNAKGEAVLDYTAYKDQMASVSAQYYGNAKYADSAVVTEAMKIKSVEIAVQTIISTADTLTVGSKATVNLPVVVIKGSTTTLDIGKDYYIQWLVDNGSGWSEEDKQYDNTPYTFTPANENSKLAAVVFPMGNYLEPAEGVSAGVLSKAATIETTTTLTVDSTDYEGSTAIVTAKVETKDKKAVLDGLVEFYVQYGVKGSGDYTKYTFATSRLNKNGEAAVTFEVPIYSIGTYQFYAHYVGTEVYGASSSDWSTKTDIKSATIAFGTSPAIAISKDGVAVDAGDVQVGETYKLTAPEVYEKGTAKVLTCGTDYYYIWQYSADGSTWETVQSDVTAAGKELENAVFGNENAEYRAIAYPMGGSGSIYRYPANGIVVATSLDPSRRTTTTTLEVSNYYAQTDTTPIFPVGRNITLTATVLDGTDPAYGVVTFSYEVNGQKTTIGSVHLDPGGVATITVPAPATVNNNYSFQATYEGNTVFATSDASARVVVLPNAIELNGKLTINDANGEVKEPVVGTAYTLKGVTANVEDANSYQTSANAVNKEHAKGVNPYYTYVWQKSEDGGVTWYNLDNAGDSNVLTNVVFETDQTQYRLAAFPVASSGWIAPAAGVYSDPVSVKTQDTEVTITMTDEAGVEISNKASRFENTEVNVTVNVSGVANYVEGSKGYVQLEVVRYHTDSKRETVYTTTGEVDNAGNVTFKVTLPAYSYNPTTGSSNQVNFVATYSGDDHFTGSELNVGQAFVNLQSAAITWPQDAENSDAFVKDITIYEGTDTSATGTTTDTMVANETYTLKLPTIYSGDVYQTSGDRNGVELTVNEDYTVQWQYRLLGEETAEWRVLSGASGDTYSVTCTEGQENYSYRAVVTPIGDYTFAMDLAFGTLTSSNKLTSNPTADTELAETQVTVTMKDTAGNVVERQASRLEGSELDITVNVSAVAGGTEGITGTVTLQRIRKHSGTAANKVETVELETLPVDEAGNVTFHVTLPDYSYDPANGLSNQVNFVAIYSGDHTFATSQNTVGSAWVGLKSAAITWPENYEDGTLDYADAAKTITIYKGTDTSAKGETVTSMNANEAYTLVLPTIYSGNVNNSNVRSKVKLVLNEDYTVQWYRQEVGSATTTGWEQITEGTGNSLYIAPDDGEVLYSYYAVVTPMGDYKFAMDETFGVLTPTNILTTLPTADTELAATTTELVITDTVIEAGTVEIAVNDRADQPFKDIGEHHSEYEGETITLTATVSNADGKVNDGNVFFYRYVDGTNDVLLNEVGIKVDTNGVAKLENVVTSDWTDSKSVTENCDKYYAVYEGTSVFDASTSINELETVYIRSTAIATPRFSVVYEGAEGTVTKYVSAYADIDGLPAATTMTFTLMDKAGSKNLGFSVTGTDGRWLTNGTDYSVQWYREEKTVDQGGVETGVVKPIEAATQVSYEKEASSLYQKYSLEAVAMGHMKTSAMSKQAIIGTTAKPVLDLDPGYTFEPTAADVYTGVTTTPGAHYGDQVTLTATIQGDETTNALPTGTVTFYYRTSDGAWTALSEPINLAQKDVAENNLVAVATYTFNSSVLPFNVDRIGYSYSGDDLYTAHEATAMQNGETSAANAKLPFKLWSVQISNPGYENATDFTNPNYTDAACYPDAKAYDDVTITVYNATVTNDGKTVTIGAEVANGEDVQAQSYYVLELDDVYTKSGEKLELAKDNSADITVEWYQSFDDGKTWSPVRVTEFTDATATQVCVKAEDSHVVYGVKVITTNSFYNSQMPELVDYGYSHENIDVVRQHVNVSVEADAATPVAGTPEWVYQRNPITLTATVTPTDQGEPSGFVKFEYAVVSALDLDENGNPKVTDDLVWTEVVSDDENPTSKAELKPVDGTAYTDNTMVAELTTSNLPVTEDGTYSVILIKATYQGDDAYAISDNIDGNSSIIASPVVRVFSSVALQDKTNIENQVVTLGKNDEGVVTWSNGSASGTAYDGFLITGKDLVSDGTQTGIVLTDVYTLDVMDRTLDLFKDKADIYTMKLNVDYTVEWQYIENYQAYQDYVNGTDEGKNWQVVPNSTSTDTCAIDQVQGYAFRAKITMLDTAKAKAAYEEFDNYGTTAVDGERVIYSNILVVGDAEARVLTNIRKASSASVKGDTVYIDAIIMGGTTTPVGNVTVTVTEKKSGEEVFSDNRNLVNGWTTFQWTDVQAGEYTIKTVLTGNNGYVGETEQDYIVRFTDKVNGGDLTMSVTNKTVTYDGQVQMLDASNVTINGFGAYTDWQELAENYVTFQYFDEDGNRVAEPVDAGTYTVKAYLPESMYWGYVTGTGTLTIEKRAVSIADVTAQAKTYDDTKTVYVQNVELEQSAQDATTGLPTGSTGIVEGDSVYVDATAHVDAAYAGERLLELDSAVLMGPDANNYTLNTNYSENFVVSRNQLYGDAVDSITAAPGYQITDEDFYMIDQAGKQITAADATITYYYHTGNDIQKVTNTNGEGKYTVVISMPENNYKGGLTTTLYIQKDAATSRDGTVDKSATSALAYITDTNHVYDGTAKSVTVTTTKGTASVQYAGADGQYTTTAPVNAGRYMVKVTVEGQTYYGVMTIVKGEPQFTFTAETVDYDGDRYNGSLNLVETTPYNVLSAAQKYGALYYTYVGGSIVGYDYNAPRDVSYAVETYVDSETSGAYGAYMVTAHVPETANTIAVMPSATFEINKIELQVIGDDIYTRLFDTHSKLTSTYDGFVGDEYGLDSELRDLIALPTYQLGDNELLSNEDMSHVGYLEIYQSDVNARNYTLKYVNGDAAINVAPTQDQLEIRNDPSTIYYGDNFQLFLYGSSVRDGDNVVQVNEASAVYWESDHPEIATVDEEGNVNIIGVGQFTITATRGDDPDTAISISETYTALKRRNDVVIERDDYLYDGQAKEIADANFSFYYMYHGTRFESLNPLSKDHCTIVGEPQTIAGEYPVTVTAINAGMNCGDGAGLLAIHRVNSVVTPDGKTAVYGNGFPGGGYTAAPIVSGDTLDDVLANGLVAADVRTNSDVDHYEILVAGGTEGWNYNVTYAPYAYSETNVNDFDVTQKALTFTVGSLADTEGMTENWREKDGTLAGTFKNLPNAAFMNSDIRTFGELNQVLDYQTRDLITGDSIADLWDMSSRANANFAKLNDAYPFSVEGAANWKLNKNGEINYEYGTLDHEPMEGAIDDAAYIISGYTDSRNYAVTIETGRLDVEQRVVKMTAPTSGIVINGGEYTSEELAEAIANQMVIEGLAEKLDHIIKDLRLTVVEVTGSQTIVGGNKTYTLKIGNTNYCTEGGGDEIEVEVTVTNITAKATIYNSGATGFKVRIYGMFDGQTRPEHINELKYTILDRNTGAVVRTGTMTYVKDETVNGILQAVYETSYAQLPNGNYTIRFEAAGYSFSY